ncbi:MAG: ribonuclease R [Trichodesmium sp. St16_bin4-tuft]|uniref:RNAse R n=1 Tax=Trichodesmium erythraeum (strain IMS101) TaxID=203124 RepID=Q115M8_TRIEI|nr:VacB/RNase II family 3'-5' exoribonuclease [Trichodesmium erythraeum GBRTRLIN201]MCH2047581.1 ribonuclease R [Trichodesmium sp. ALOHA_ZT_67]MDE5068110.1 ribonuclease R [Trichodesmium sp. St4_bin8_1]MDE5070510.1 ribonuclease R [Trichodesmium sp. St5_bin8]MDE5101407.1 ribonuclease R [Trichodesmium sp. St16_bin4-tuft]MDT9341041.1 ribonuclease R [Trichodesmium erythraeum 21-75]
MKFSIATLLANFSDDKLIAPKAVEKKLDCQDDQSIRKLQIALDALERIGVLAKDKGRYRRLFEEALVEAKLRCSSKGFCFAIQDLEGTEDIYIRESHLSNAWNGDRVFVKIIKEGSRRRSPEGEVKLILERANPSLLARIKQINGQNGDPYYRAVPLDDRLLFELDLVPEGPDLADAIDHLVHVEVLRYPLGEKRPIGKVVQILGSDAEAADDLDIVCCKHDLPRSFPNTVLKEAESLVSHSTKADQKNRLDLRELLTVSFGELEKKDINHALSIETTTSGYWRVGVHIADVAYFIKVDSPLDKEARKRAISIYLRNEVVPILPDGLSSDYFSLLPKKDRLAISILITVNKNGQIVEFEIEPSVIQVNVHLSYEQTKKIINGNTDGLVDINLEQLENTINKLQDVSHAVRNARLRRGAFDLNLPDEKSYYNDESPLGAMIIPNIFQARSMVAELIVLANQAIASHLLALGVPAIYRVQNSPEPGDIQEFIKLASHLGSELYLEDEEYLQPADYQAFVEEFTTSKSERVLTYLLEDTLKPAIYSTTAQPHFGLALQHGYVHCTSPISRYSDLLISRVLHTVFNEGRDRRSSRSKEGVELGHSSCHGKISWNVLAPEIQQELEAQLTSVVVHLTERENIAQDGQEDLEGLIKTGLMKERTGQTFPGLITGVQSYGFFVEIEISSESTQTFRVEGLVHVSSLKDDWYEYRSRQQTLVGRKNRNQYRLGDIVEVQVKSVDYYRQQIDLVAVSGGSTAFDDEEFSSNPYRF